MIRSIKFSNFYSFNKVQDISFLAKKKRSYSYSKSKSGDYITKVAAFIGPNASGKTNVMRLLSFLSYFVCSSSKDDSVPYNEIAFKNYFDNSRPSTFSLEYEDKGKIFIYDLKIQNNVVLKEEVYCKEIAKYAKASKMFTREKDILTYLNPKYFKNFPARFVKNIRLDVSIIAFLKAHYNIEIINLVYDYFFKFKTNINERGETNNPVHQLKVLELYLKDKKLKREMEEFVSNFSLGLDGFEIRKQVDEKGSRVISVTGLHNSASKEEKLDFIYESRGTRSLFFSFANIFTGIKSNSVIIIDELEFGLHPEALNKLIGYIIDKNQKNRAQVLFSSHSLGFMNKLDMHQLYLVDKSIVGESKLFRLNEVKDIRSDENFLNKYMTGAYGAFPDIKV